MEKEKTKPATEIKTSESIFKAPTINLPKGGGAIRGMGEKFAANPVTGTGSMTVPIATSPGRSGFGPQLNLSYDSGSGNGPFGFGWNLSLPAITRKTDKGLPRYADGKEDQTDSDVFIISGAEDLVPVLIENAQGKWVLPDISSPDGAYFIRRYRPRIEGLFARIERWTNVNIDGDVHWRSISKDNVLTIYGKDNNSRVYDPDNQKHIFSWLISETRDDKGNAIHYEYKAEDGTGINLSRAHEHNRRDRNSPHRQANRYIKYIRYGNRASLLDSASKRPYFVPFTNVDWMFEVVFDYGEHDLSNPAPDDRGQWSCRNDPFSSYRAGFEIRTYRLCQRILMFHQFTELDQDPYLVRSTDFMYCYEQDPADARNPIYSFLVSATQTGYRWNNGHYLAKSLPPLEFGYSPVFTPEELARQPMQDVDADSLENLPFGLDGASYQWMDLDGEGTSGILTEQAGCWYYKRNLSANHQVGDPGQERTVPRFGATEIVARKPAGGLAGGGQFLDLAGDGQVDLVQMEGPVRGFYERTDEADWESLRSFDSWPDINLHDPNLRFVDLSGDGHADFLITESEALTWHPSLAERGFGPAIRLSLPLDEERGPRIVFADGTQSVYLADLSGDGLTDLVRIRNGETCYWPNLGYGRFGAKVTMDNSPWFDAPDQFNQQRIRLADIDGSGTTDIIYLRRDAAQIYFNQSGNRWSDPVALPQFPPVDSLASVQVVDLLSNGTACLVWSSSLPGTSRQPMRYLALMPEKPHLLVNVKNNLGAETKIQYAPSTKFYLDDKQNGKPWITRLPFPVYVVERVEVFDHISRNHFVTRYAYHHGYFDGVEREFHGFGMVEQWDTDEFDKLNPEASNVDYRWHMPPVHTKTWLHTGAFIEGARISQQMVHEYFGAPLTQADFDTWVKDTLLADTVLPSASLTAQESRQACRALKGAILRQEIYADDHSVQAGIPYSVLERNYTIRLVQRQADNRHAVFFTHARETIDYHYERNLTDPRVGHSLTIEVDNYGNILKSVAIGYGRKNSLLSDPSDRDKQTISLITYTDQSVTNAIDDPALYPDDYRAPISAETRTYELTGFQSEKDAIRFSFDQFARNDCAALISAEPLDYEQTIDITKPQKRLIENVRTLYRRNDLTGLSPFGEVETLALPGESYKLAFTAGLLDKVYKRARNGQPDEDLLPDRASVLEGKGGDQGGYSKLDGKWWIPSGRVFYDQAANVNDPATTAAAELEIAQQHFFLPRKFVDPFKQSILVDYDIHDLLAVKTQDALLNTISTQPNYRVLQLWQITDPNGNRAEVAFDALGLVVGTAMRGKETENLGGNLSLFNSDLAQSEIDNFHNSLDPHALAPGLIKDADTRIIYDLHRFYHSRQASPDDSTKWDAPYAATLARETHASKNVPVEDLKIQISFSYSDGFGREIQKKIQAEPGKVEVEDAAGTLTIEDTGAKLRWVGSGWTIFNNKGKPVRQYEPFFSTDHHFQYGKIVGVSPVLFYDPLERVVVTLHPNNTYEKAIFDPWQQTTWDVNDTVSLDPRTDADTKDVVERYFASEPADWKTWSQLRLEGSPNLPSDTHGQDREQDAAVRTLKHANTPTVAHFDMLGRTFLTIADNGKDVDGNPLLFKTRAVLDIEGNQREVIDAKNRVVMYYDYDMLGNRIDQASMDAGQRWMLNDVVGKPIRAWDERNHEFTYRYDELRRPTEMQVKGGDGQVLLNNSYEKIIYGEGKVFNGKTDRELNLRGKPFEHYDTGGRVQFEEYDFKGNLLKSNRCLAIDYKNIPHWGVANPDSLLEGNLYPAATEYDALNRITESTTPDGSVTTPAYNSANLLEKVDVLLHDGSLNHFVTGIDYNEKGQRKEIIYGTGVETSYEYERETFRLIHLETRQASGKLLQDLRYTYDPVGNITEIEDRARPTIFFNNFETVPVNQYMYDAIYRLIEAHGREHIAQVGFDPRDNWNDHPFMKQYSVNDPMAWQTYTQCYRYDAVGNIERMQHYAPLGGWTRDYAYEAGNNRLRSTTVGDPLMHTYLYSHHPQHGFMTEMPHLEVMDWNFKEELQAVAQQRRTDGGTPEITYYVYDFNGQRIRKVTEKTAAEGVNPRQKSERIYVGETEICKEYSGNHAGLERKTLHVMDDKSRIAMIETRNHVDDGSPSKLVRYQFGNHLGTACLETDETGRVISYEEYHPYGTTSHQVVDKDIKAAAKRYRYTGKERDDESGLYYHGARYYAPWLGRWASCDPESIAEGTNLFVYSENSPIIHIDPNGASSKQKVSELASDAIPQKPELNNLWPYDKQVPNRQGLGKNVQREHPVPVAVRKEQRTGPGGKQHHNRKVSAQKGQPTILLETGKATPTQPAKPHTQIKETQMAILADVKSGKLKSESDLLGRVQDGYEEVNKSLAAQKKPEIPKKVVDKALLADQAVVHGTIQETAKELKELGSPAKTMKDIEKAVESVDQALSPSKTAKVMVKLGKAGRHLAAAVPVAGIVLGQASAAHAATQGDYAGAALDEAGFIPVAGDLLDAARGGYALGEAMNEGLDIEKVAMRGGEQFERCAQSLGLGEDATRVAGATGAALTALAEASLYLSPLTAPFKIASKFF